MPPYPLTNFEVQKYYENKPRFNGVYSRDNLPKIKDGTYVINLDEYCDMGTGKIIMLPTSVLLMYNVFQKKLNHLLTFLDPLLHIIKT